MAKKQLTFDQTILNWQEWLAGPRGNKVKVVKGDVGIEVECEGKLGALDRAGFFWEQHEEASIRGGTEFVLSKPVPMELLGKAITELRERTNLCALNPDSPRTSVHVHQNVQRYTIRELYSVLLAYWAFENILVRMNGTSREGNLFCCRAVDAEGLCHGIIHDLNNGILLPTDWDGTRRYAALNLSALCKFGSIEFRFMKGLTDWTKVELWARSLNEFCEIARKWTWDDILNHFHHDRGATRLNTFERFFPNAEFLDMARASVTPDYMVQSMTDNLDNMFLLHKTLKRVDKALSVKTFPGEDEDAKDPDDPADIDNLLENEPRRTEQETPREFERRWAAWRHAVLAAQQIGNMQEMQRQERQPVVRPGWRANFDNPFNLAQAQAMLDPPLPNPDLLFEDAPDLDINEDEDREPEE